MTDTTCPVCEFNLGFTAWTSGNPSFEICPSCGIQFGYNDHRTGLREHVYREWRAAWLANDRQPLHGPQWRTASIEIAERASRARDEQLGRILAIGHDTSIRGEGISLREALSRARYRECRAGLQEVDLLRLIRAERELVDQWLAYSEDKRTEGGWYVLGTGEVGKIKKPESRIHSATIEEAIAAICARSCREFLRSFARPFGRTRIVRS